ncbi:MAG: exodeoxyribonuclease VII large subunit [Muribaculaceae bacterium]|nr:exodeoxyribonuclease VII large subunit [Muribaculaceae bacterium]
MAENNALTLQQLQQLIGNTVRMNPQLQGVWVTAELSDVRIAGGHCYMELVEKDVLGNTCAKMRAMIWNNTLNTLRGKFYVATGKDICAGMKVMVRGSANHHNLYGLSFTISDIDPAYTVGDMERIRREILERLHREGLLDRNRSLRFPPVPQRIAVISAEGAAGYGEFMNQLLNNPDGFKFYTHLFPAVMQGEKTSQSVRNALGQIRKSLDLWDCVVIIRGGGATTDLNGFDEYEVAKAVAVFPLPVAVGIGHERDRTVLDEIACMRCKTPTAVAAMLIDSLRLAYAATVERVKKIARYSADAMKGEKYRIANIETALPARVQTRIMRSEKRLGEIGHSIERALSRRYSSESERMRMIRYRFEKACLQVTEKPATKLKNLENMVRVLSPQNTVSRGYSLTLLNGKAVKSVSELRKGDTVTTCLSDGTVESTVK